MEARGQHLLDDFCRIVKLDLPCHSTPLRLERECSVHTRSENSDLVHQVYELDPVFVNDSPANQKPMSLAEAMRNGLLSAESKIQLAFTISKSYWQFYQSEWMQSTWNLDTIVLVPQEEETHALDIEARSPFLRICRVFHESPVPREDEDVDPVDRSRRMHRHPYILSLCLLLVLLCTSSGLHDAPLQTPNQAYFFCAKRVKHKRSDWPEIDLLDPYKQRYSDIVQSCLPQPCQRLGLSIAERRQWLMDKVVRPLHDLLRDMRNPVVDTDPHDGLQATDDGKVDNVQEISRYVTSGFSGITARPPRATKQSRG